MVSRVSSAMLPLFKAWMMLLASIRVTKKRFPLLNTIIIIPFFPGPVGLILNKLYCYVVVSVGVLNIANIAITSTSNTSYIDVVVTA